VAFGPILGPIKTHITLNHNHYTFLFLSATTDRCCLPPATAVAAALLIFAFFEVIYIYIYYISFDCHAFAITQYGFRYNSIKEIWGLRYDPLSDFDNTGCRWIYIVKYKSDGTLDWYY